MRSNSSRGQGLPIVPSCLRNALEGDSSVTGEFLVCPFTHDKPGVMRMVCVQEVGRLTVRRWDKDKKGDVETTVPGCELPDSNSDPTDGKPGFQHWPANANTLF